MNLPDIYICMSFVMYIVLCMCVFAHTYTLMCTFSVVEEKNFASAKAPEKK